MERAHAALRICRQKLADRPIARARLIATEACRSAGNGAAFLARVRGDLGLDLEIIDRRTEARLAVEGCFSLIDAGAEGAVLFDIGGGSSEIVWLDRRKARRRGGLMRAWVSLPLGVVTLAERYGGVEVDGLAFEAMVQAARAEFHRFHAGDALKKAVRERAFHFLGTSGTVTTLAGVHLDLPRYDRRSVDGLWMEEGDIERMMKRSAAWITRRGATIPASGASAPIWCLAGCAIFEAIRREWPCKRLRVADRGLREGILVQLMRADGFLRGRRGAHSERWPSVAKPGGSRPPRPARAGEDARAAARCRRSAGWSGSSTTPTWRAPRQEGYRSRAAYKLLEIDERYQTISATGSAWSTSAPRPAAGRRLRPRGSARPDADPRVVAVD